VTSRYISLVFIVCAALVFIDYAGRTLPILRLFDLDAMQH
jgi:hypothetical protein